MTADHPIRRFLARVCSGDTMSRVVDPTFADIRWERGRPAIMGYVSLVKALAVHALTSAPETARRVYADDDHAVPRTAAHAIATAIIAAALLVAVPFISTIHRAPLPPAHPFLGALLVMIGALVLTLPAALLVAIPLGLKRHQPSARLARRIVGLSIVWAAITLAMLVWITPAANQSYRALVDGKPVPQFGGQGLNGMKREIERLQTFHGSETIVRQMQYHYEARLALTTSAVPIGLAALAMAFSRVGRRRPLLIGVAALGIYLLAVFPFNTLAMEFVLRRTSLPVTPLAWLPNAILVLAAGVLTSSTVRQSANRQSPIASRQ
jgi:hypothetical protein